MIHDGVHGLELRGLEQLKTERGGRGESAREQESDRFKMKERLVLDRRGGR